MSIMKRDLLITIEAGRDTCQECEYRDDDECDLFGFSLDDEGHRRPECIEAEGKMVDAFIRGQSKFVELPVVETEKTTTDNVTTPTKSN
jgi:hypothetical protein